MRKRLQQLTQHLTKAEEQRYRKLNSLEIASTGFRRARSRSLIQLGALMDKAGLLETFQITLGADMQKDPEMKEPVAALFKGLLVLNEMAQSEEANLSLWARQGLEAFRMGG